MSTIVVGLDTSPRASAVLRAATALAKAKGAKLMVVHAVQLPPELPSNLWMSGPDRTLEDLFGVARKAIDDLAKSVPSDVLGGVRIQAGVPWREICEVAREHDADTIVVGAHGYGTLDRILGTTAARVVNHADRTVLVVRG